MSAVPAEAMQLDVADFAAFALREVHDHSPDDVWARMDERARQHWLSYAGQGWGWCGHAWSTLPPHAQKCLRNAMRQMVVFLGQAGVDLFNHR